MLHLRDTENGCVLACTRSRTLPPLDHAPIHQRRGPKPLPRTPLLVLMAVARNAEGALCAGRSALQKGAVGGPTGANNTMQARASDFLEHHTSPALVTRMPLHTRHHKSHSRGAGRGAARLWGPGTLCLSAPFAPLRPPDGRAGTALSSHQCLMLPQRAFA